MFVFGILYQRGKWHSLEIQFNSEDFEVKIDDFKSKTFGNPVKNPNRRLFLGEGYEIDAFESNRGSEFFIDVGSFVSQVK